MSRTFDFTSSVRFGPTLDIPYNVEQIKNEPMLHGCNYDYSYRFGGDLTRKFLKELEFQFSSYWCPVIIDSKVVMLMPEMYPCIANFHVDDVPRELPNKQPNHIEPSYKSRHCMMLVGNNVSNTEFVIGSSSLTEPPEDKIIYGVWDKILKAKIESGELSTLQAPQNTLLYFDWQTFHRGMPAKGFGWRFFIRATIESKRPVLNELRKQVQVYVDKDVCW